jgi:hypothetical protein
MGCMNTPVLPVCGAKSRRVRRTGKGVSYFIACFTAIFALADKSEPSQRKEKSTRLALPPLPSSFSSGLSFGAIRNTRSIATLPSPTSQACTTCPRVNLFAQELKTPVPVSVKRLQKQWEGMRGG